MSHASALILGAGFGGISAAVQLARRVPDPGSVMLVEQRTHFAAGTRKIWHATGLDTLQAGLRPLTQLGQQHGVTVKRGTVEQIDARARAAVVDGEQVEAEAIVIALGSSPVMPSIPGLRQHGINVWDSIELDRVRSALTALRAGRVIIAIAGSPYSCPPAPYELAFLIRDVRGEQVEVTVMTPAPLSLPAMGPEISGRLDELLAAARIEVRTESVIGGVGADELVTNDGKRHRFDLLLVVPPHVSPTVLAKAHLSTPDGWVAVDRHTLRTTYPGVYAVGDCVGIPIGDGRSLPKAGVFAAKQGLVVASQIAGEVAAFDGVGSCIVEVGRGRASELGGNFFSDPQEAFFDSPTRQRWEAKRRDEASLLGEWFGE